MAERKPGPVLVTGANSGIGLASALLLAERGWDVHGTVRSESKAEALWAAAKDAGVGSRVHPVLLDVSDHRAIVAAWPELPDFYAVVNNAGYSETGAIEEVSAERARAQLDVNVIAPAVIASCVLPAMRRRGAGRIVNVSSIAGRAVVMPLNGWYHASKFALEALSDVLRVEVASFGVKVVLIEPGFFKTEIGERSRGQTRAAREHAGSPYARAYDRVASGLDLVERFAPAPNAVARTIATAIESSRPRARYLVGADALATAATIPWIPRELTDLGMRLAAGLFSSAAPVKASRRKRD
ncbi:MAG TPA: SDR family oxidoreductase [Myxococcota bacterium]|nr:SDR family oxidoreductase [Myxococcota bacterium]